MESKYQENMVDEHLFKEKKFPQNIVQVFVHKLS